MGPVVSQVASFVLPEPSRLSEAVAALAAREDHLGVIRVVEAWSAQSPPPVEARLAQGRAFLAVCLADRAMARAQEVLESEPRNASGLRLLAEVYLARGWPTKARKPLSALREQGEKVDAAWERAHQEPAHVDASEADRAVDTSARLQVAERLLLTGSALRGRSVLERVRQARPDDTRARHLLWALDGDFSVSALELSLLLQDAATGDGDEPEHTETVIVPQRPAAAPASPRGFPTLFQGASGGDAEEEPHEVTQTSGVLPMTEGPASAGDTQIMLVIRPGERAAPVSGPVHARREVTETGAIIERNLDLAAWKATMGMRAAAPASDLDEGTNDLLEAEDENVVVMTRPEADDPSEDSLSFEQPIEVIEKRPVPRLRSASAAPETDAPRAGAPSDASGPRRASPRGTFVLTGVALVGAALLGIGLVTGKVGGGGGDADRLRRELVDALGQQDARVNAAQEASLRERAEGGDAAAVAALATVRAATWEDFDPAQDRRRAVEVVLEQPGLLAPTDASELAARLRLADGDVAAAQSALASVAAPPRDAEARIVAARVALGRGALSEAETTLAAGEAPTARQSLVLAEIRLAQGRLGDALSVLRAHAVEPSFGVRLETLLADGIPEALWPSTDRTRLVETAPMPPRLLATHQANLAMAALRANDLAGMTSAVARGLSADPGHPRLVWLRAALDLDEGHRLAAADALEQLGVRWPADRDIRVARVLTLLELDRVDEASKVVSAVAAPDATTQALGALVTLARGQLPADLGVTTSPLGLWASSLRRAQGRLPGAPAALEAAAVALEAAPDLHLRRLAPVARAMIPLAGVQAVPPVLPTAEGLDAVVSRSSRDARVHVAIARTWERLGGYLRAAQHYDRAVTLAPELAEAWYERGRFYATAPDGGARARECFTRYLALAPSGARAERARKGGGVSP